MTGGDAISTYVAARKDACLRAAACYLLAVIRRHRVTTLLAAIFSFMGTLVFYHGFSRVFGEALARLPGYRWCCLSTKGASAQIQLTQPQGNCHVLWHRIYPFRLDSDVGEFKSLKA
jgi:hypothetical protein